MIRKLSKASYKTAKEEAMIKDAPTNEDVPPLLEGGGKLEVWRIDGSAKTPVPKEDIGKFYSGDCYIVLYTYHLGEKKEEDYLCCWIGKDCKDDQNMAAQLASSMSNSCKRRPVEVCINQGKEPPQFVAIFKPIVVLKGGLSFGYKKFVTDNGVNDETYTAECVALIRIPGTAVHNNKAVQVDAVATSLNSNDCFLLQSGSSIFIWHGNQSTHEQQQLAAEVAEFLKPGVPVKLFKEGTESSAFWLALGGKQSYISKEVPQEIVRDSTKTTVNYPNHFIKDMYYEIEHNLLGEYADTLGMTNFVVVINISVGRVQLRYPSLVSLKSFATSTRKTEIPFMNLPLDVEDSVAFLGRSYTFDDLKRAGMNEGLSFFVPEKFLPEIMGLKVDLTPSYTRLLIVDESVQGGVLNKNFALVPFTRFGGYRFDDPLEDARYSVDMHLTWVDGMIKSVEDSLSKKIFHLRDSDYWAIKTTFVKEGQRVVDEFRANPKCMLPRIFKSLKERRKDLKWFHGASARILLSFEKLDSEFEYFPDLKMSKAAELKMPLGDEILSLLEKHQYLSLKELIDLTAQPADLIKAILKKCCKCNRAGENRHKYEISQDYRKSEEYAESKVRRRCLDRDLPELPGLARKAKSPNKSRPNPGWGRSTEP